MPDSRWKLISIHALREEGDQRPSEPLQTHSRFLSTPSARRATEQHFRAVFQAGGGDRFLSTPSARRATYGRPLFNSVEDISIHALREEGDAAHSAGSRRSTNFYPRPPRGGRPTDTAFIEVDYLFLSTPSARRATDGLAQLIPDGLFLSTPSARRATQLVPHLQWNRPIFLSTPSARRATSACQDKRIGLRFLSTPSARRATQLIRCRNKRSDISIHALREEGDCRLVRIAVDIREF